MRIPSEMGGTMKLIGGVAATVSGLLATGALAGQAVRLEATFEPTRAVLGTPVSVVLKLTNEGDAAIRVPLLQHVGIALTWAATPAEGTLEPKGLAMGKGTEYSLRYQELGPGRTQEYWVSSFSQRELLPRFCAPGTYTVDVTIDTRPFHLGKFDAFVAVAKGVRIEIVAPQGEDQEAYRSLLAHVHARGGLSAGCDASDVASVLFWRGSRLLIDFPSSTYSAYLVWFHSFAMRWAQRMDIDENLRAIRSRGPRLQFSVPCDREPCGPGGTMKYDTEARAWRARWADIVLSSHPDIWFADDLRFTVACDKVVEGDSVGGRADLEALSSSAVPKIAAKARAVLETLRPPAGRADGRR